MTDHARRLARLQAVQQWCLWVILPVWVACWFVNLLDGNWPAVATSAGAFLTTLTALSATRARNRLQWVVLDHRSKGGPSL